MPHLVSVMALCEINEISSKQKTTYVWADTGPKERVKKWWLLCKASVKNWWIQHTRAQKIIVGSS